MKYLVLFLLGFSLLGCQQVKRHNNGHQEQASRAGKMQRVEWIVGQWEMKTPEGIVSEQWTKVSDSMLQGVSYMVSVQGDTPFRESIRLEYSKDTLYYRPVVNNQNGGGQVSFIEKSLQSDEVVFENLMHDFPQRIIYRRVNDTAITATVEGKERGTLRKEEFAYTRRHQ